MTKSLKALCLLAVSLLGFQATGLPTISYSRVFPLANKIPSAGSVLVKVYMLKLLEFRAQATAEQIFLIALSCRNFTGDVIVTVVFPILNA